MATLAPDQRNVMMKILLATGLLGNLLLIIITSPLPMEFRTLSSEHLASSATELKASPKTFPEAGQYSHIPSSSQIEEVTSSSHIPWHDDDHFLGSSRPSSQNVSPPPPKIVPTLATKSKVQNLFDSRSRYRRIVDWLKHIRDRHLDQAASIKLKNLAPKAKTVPKQAPTSSLDGKKKSVFTQLFVQPFSDLYKRLKNVFANLKSWGKTKDPVHPDGLVTGTREIHLDPKPTSFQHQTSNSPSHTPSESSSIRNHHIPFGDGTFLSSAPDDDFITWAPLINPHTHGIITPDTFTPYVSPSHYLTKESEMEEFIKSHPPPPSSPLSSSSSSSPHQIHEPFEGLNHQSTRFDSKSEDRIHDSKQFDSTSVDHSIIQPTSPSTSHLPGTKPNLVKENQPPSFESSSPKQESAHRQTQLVSNKPSPSDQTTQSLPDSKEVISHESEIASSTPHSVINPDDVSQLIHSPASTQSQSIHSLHDPEFVSENHPMNLIGSEGSDDDQFLDLERGTQNLKHIETTQDSSAPAQQKTGFEKQPEKTQIRDDHLNSSPPSHPKPISQTIPVKSIEQTPVDSKTVEPLASFSPKAKSDVDANTLPEQHAHSTDSEPNLIHEDHSEPKSTDSSVKSKDSVRSSKEASSSSSFRPVDPTLGEEPVKAKTWKHTLTELAVPRQWVNTWHASSGWGL